MSRFIFLLSLLSIAVIAAEDVYEFKGRHFLASFMNCDREIMADSDTLAQVMEKAINLTGAEILSERRHDFKPHGMTEVFLLSESHASIHTYPEHGSCFVDLFTCGDHCDWRPFFETLKTHLKCENFSSMLLMRGETSEIKENIQTLR